MNLTTDTDLAEQFGITVEKLHWLRKANNWPHVRLGRNAVRFTEAQIAQIIASQSVLPTKQATTAGTGLTGRSAKRTGGAA